MTLLAFSLCAVACGPPKPRPVDLATVPREYTSLDYGRVLSRWTRQARLQKDFDKVAPFDTALDVRATFEAWDWRWAYVERYAEYYRLPAGEKDKLRDAELKIASEHHDFHVSATASRWEWTNFLNAQKSMWRVVLFDDRGKEIEPSERMAVKTPITKEVAFFPYVGTFDQPFLSLVVFRFPTKLPDGTPTIDPSTKQVTLRFSGPLGTVDLVWKTVHGEPGVE